MTDELKACPFCGGEATITGTTETLYVQCSDCDCVEGLYDYSKEDKAIKAWNTRPIEDALRTQNAELVKALEEAFVALMKVKTRLEIYHIIEKGLEDYYKALAKAKGVK